MDGSVSVLGACNAPFQTRLCAEISGRCIHRTLPAVVTPSSLRCRNTTTASAVWSTSRPALRVIPIASLEIRGDTAVTTIEGMPRLALTEAIRDPRLRCTSRSQSPGTTSPAILSYLEQMPGNRVQGSGHSSSADSVPPYVREASDDERSSAYDPSVGTRWRASSLHSQHPPEDTLAGPSVPHGQSLFEDSESFEP